jgi:hypothetical protein
MKKLVVLLLVSLMATSAFAVLDPDVNGVGMYFDTNADVNALEIGPGLQFQVYVMITNPEFDVSGIEFGYNVITTPGSESSYFRLSEVFPAGAINIGQNANAFLGDYVIGLADPVPASPAVVMVTWTCMTLVPMAVEFYVTPSSIPSLPGDPVPAYEAGGFILPLQQSSGGPDAPVACVNSCTPVAVEGASFGSVKSLFR